MRGGGIDDQPHPNLRALKLERREARALEERPRLRRPHFDAAGAT